MYYEHPFKIDGVYYAKIDGAMIEISEELAKAMLSFYRKDKHYVKRWMPDLKSKDEQKKEEEELQKACGELLKKLEEEEQKDSPTEDLGETDNTKNESQKSSTESEKSRRKDLRREMILDCVFRENTEGLTIEDLPDAYSVEQQVLKAIEYEALNKVLAMLSKEERYLIDAVYYRKIPQIVLARKYGITPPAINKKVKCILFKIRSLYGSVEF